MGKKTKKRDPMPPPDATPEEIGEFWDTHSITDYWDETYEVEFQVNIKPKQKPIPAKREKAEEISVEEIPSIIRGPNMNQQSQMQIGNFVPFGRIKASEIGYPDSEAHLTEILRTFNYTDILITLARINLLLQRSDNLLECESILRQNFCSRILRNEIDIRGLTEHLIFTRESTLLLLSKSMRFADPGSTRTPDLTVDARNELGRCYLIANGLLDTEFPNLETDSIEDERKEVPVGLIPSLEYAITPLRSPRLKNAMVRSKEFLERFQKAFSSSDDIDMNETFFRATGLTPKDYQHLIFSILTVALSFSPEEILDGRVSYVDTKRYPALTPLYEKLLQRTCISIDELARKAATPPSLHNEFLLWREYPLVKISEDQIMCVDIGFLAEKLETGVFWIIRNKLEKDQKGKGKRIIDRRGDVVADYVESIIKRVLPPIEAQTADDVERYIIKPEYIQKQQAECTDIAICGSETLILLECKATLLSAQTKFSGDAHKFYNNLKDKIIEPTGIEQLWNAIQFLGHTDKKERREVAGIDISKVKKIYPVLVLSERIFSLPQLNGVLNWEFQRFVKRDDLEDHLKIIPLTLTVLTIEDLEFLEPYLSDTPFHVHLDRWITQIFNRNDFFPFSEYLRSLREKEVRQNTYIDQEFSRIRADIKKYFASWGID